ncbi:hypothetical protein GCM10009663_57340 [Kitasatospora arboriphila]|uniref:DUF4177 domain-containing protein n=1 Tax=Kitasatospora arboriphila TaxID=258052 RepID=A0ABN1TXU1_9ACTN
MQAWEYQWLGLKQVWRDIGVFGEWEPVVGELKQKGREGWEVVGVFRVVSGDTDWGTGEWAAERRREEKKHPQHFGWALLKRPVPQHPPLRVTPDVGWRSPLAPGGPTLR